LALGLSPFLGRQHSGIDVSALTSTWFKSDVPRILEIWLVLLLSWPLKV
jgi:hypothetical protein